MDFPTIYGFDDFTAAVRTAGFTLSGDNADGVFSLARFYGPGIAWHTEDRETDPWQWRIRAIAETGDIAYGKYFFGKGGYITREWYPMLVAARRDNREFDDLYADGVMSRLEKDVYELIRDRGRMAKYQLRACLPLGPKEGGRLDAALVSLQMKLLVGVCGETRKLNRMGEPYGWPVSVFCLAEELFGGWEQEAADREDAADILTDRVLELNPRAEPRRVRRFVMG